MGDGLLLMLGTLQIPDEKPPTSLLQDEKQQKDPFISATPIVPAEATYV